MHAKNETPAPGPKNRAIVERTSERELVVTRTVRGRPRLVFEAWTRAELLQAWWVPKSFGITLVSCEVDARVGGEYRFVFVHGDSEPTPFFGRYLEVVPHSRLVWTNEEGEAGGPVTTVTFEEKAGDTRVTLHELYPSKDALDACMASGEKSCLDETFDQLDELLAAPAAG